MSTATLAPTRGGVVCDWIESTLVHGPGDFYGQPFRLADWQRALIYRLYELTDDGLARKYNRALIGIPKGNGKTELLAAIALYEMLAGDPVLSRGTPDVPIAAASYDQADLLFGAAKTIVGHENCPLKPFVNPFDKEIVFADGTPGSVYRVAAEAGTNDGRLPSVVCADELHEWTARKKRVFTVLSNGLAKRQNTIGIYITTAGAKGAESVAEDLYTHGMRCRSGDATDDRFLFVWFAADESLDLDDEAQLRQAIEQANPAADTRPGGWLSVDNLVLKWQNREIPEYEYRRYHLNQWTAAESNPFVPAGIFEQLEELPAPPDGEPVWLYFDGSHNRDSSALWGAYRRPETELESMTAEELTQHLDEDQLEQLGARLADITAEESDPIPRLSLFRVGLWERPPDARDGWRVPRAEVDKAVDDAMRRWTVRQFGLDPWGWFEELDRWQITYGDEVVLEVPTREIKRWSAYCSRFYAACVTGRLAHDHDGALARHLSNAVPHESTAGTYVRKERANSKRKIDALIAAIGAHGLATEYTDETEVNIRWL